MKELDWTPLFPWYVRVLPLFLKKLLWHVGFWRFKPAAFYKESLQIFEVVTAKCSYTERSLTDRHFISLFERNHVEWGEPTYIGFNLWLSKEDCFRMLGKKPSKKVSLREVLETLYRLEKNPNVRAGIREVCLRILTEHKLDKVKVV